MPEVMQVGGGSELVGSQILEFFFALSQHSQHCTGSDSGAWKAAHPSHALTGSLGSQTLLILPRTLSLGEFPQALVFTPSATSALLKCR